MSALRFTPVIQSLPASVPFVGPEIQERAKGRPYRARLGANENVFGPSPKAIRAMQDAAPEIWKYGDSASHDLKTALAAHLGVGVENLMIGAGIDGLLNSLARLLVEPGTPVVTSAGAYPTFNYHVNGYGGEIEAVPFREDHEDPLALLDRAHEVKAPLLYFCNPDNPMGSWHRADVVQGMIDTLTEQTVLCLDEAYLEFAPENTAPPIDVSRPNVIRMRTFSKAYGMAGARVGYAIGHADLIGAFNKVRNHFGMNRAAQAGALAALQDQDYLARTIANVAGARDRIAQIATENGLTPLPSATNFVTIDCGEGPEFAKAVVKALDDLDIFIRMPFVAPQNRCIRISAGRPEDLALLQTALPTALHNAREALT